NFKSGDPCLLETNKSNIKSRYIIMATHTPLGIYSIQTTIYPYREEAIAVTLKDEDYPPPGIFWGLTKDQHYSLRSYSTGDQYYLVVAGEYYKVGQAGDVEKRFADLEDFARNRFNIDSVEYRWAAQSYIPADSLPYIGELEDRIYTG